MSENVELHKSTPVVHPEAREKHGNCTKEPKLSSQFVRFSLFWVYCGCAVTLQHAQIWKTCIEVCWNTQVLHICICIHQQLSFNQCAKNSM